jgi:predicted phosphohydrolase
MKVDYISDLHLERIPIEEHQVEANLLLETSDKDSNILILAGDIINIHELHSSVFINTLCEEYEYVLFVPGNHEYYNISIKSLPSKQLPNNFIFLNNARFEYNNISFFGTTLWSDTSEYLETTIEERLKRIRLYDFRVIEGLDLKVYRELYTNSVKSLKKEKNVDVVITHHSPCYLSIPYAYTTHPLNMFFASHLLEQLDELPKVWVHGHIHTMVNYKYKDTRVISNPYFDYNYNIGNMAIKTFEVS